MAVIAFTAMTPLSYADSGFEDTLFGLFDWINELVTPTIQDPSLDNSTQSNYQDALDSGTDAGKKGVSLWFSIHEFFVNIIFAGTTSAELPIDKDIIVIISMLAVTAMVIILIRHLIKENVKIAIAVIGVLILLAVLGFTVEF